MPHLQQITIKATDVRPGDIHYPSCQTVRKVERKRTRGVFVLDNGVEIPVRLDDFVAVDRLTYTQEEQDAKRREVSADRIRARMEDAHKQSLGDVLAQYAAVRPNNPLDSWRLPEFLETQATYGFWMNVRRIEARYLEAGVDANDALFAAFYGATSRDRYPTNPLSRSTSTMSNILDDLTLYVIDKAREWALGFGYTTEADLVEAHERVTAAVRDAKAQASGEVAA